MARRLGEEQVGAVELAHVANPVRLEDRLAARDRQRVIGADRPLGVFLQVVEVGRFVPVVDAVEDGEVHLQHLLDAVEHATDGCGFIGAGKLPDVAIGEQIEVQLGPDPVHHPRERRAEVRPSFEASVRDMYGSRMSRSTWFGDGRLHAEAVVDDDRLKVVVEERGQHRVLERAGHDDFVDELILVASQSPPRRAQLLPQRPGSGHDDEHFEVGLARRSRDRASAEGFPWRGARHRRRSARPPCESR